MLFRKLWSLPASFVNLASSSSSTSMGTAQRRTMCGHSSTGGAAIQLRRQGDDVKVVVQVIALAAVLCLAGDAGMALPELANAAEVVAGLVGEKDIGAQVDLPSRALQLPAGPRQLPQIGAAFDPDQQVGVLGHRLLGRERAEQGDAKDAVDVAGPAHEGEDRREQDRTGPWDRWPGSDGSSAPHAVPIALVRSGIALEGRLRAPVTTLRSRRFSSPWQVHSDSTS